MTSWHRARQVRFDMPSSQTFVLRIRAIVNHPLFSLHTVSTIFFHLFLAYWLSGLGYFLGKLWRTPDIASIFASTNAWPTPYAPGKLRYFAWLVLLTGIAIGATSIWKLWRACKAHGRVSIVKALTPDGAGSHLSAREKVTPQTSHFPASAKLPFATTDIITHPVAHPSADRRALASLLARLGYALLMISFSLSFIRWQHVGTPLYTHPVNSPLLLIGEDRRVELSKSRDPFELDQYADMQMGVGLALGSLTTAALDEMIQSLPGPAGLRSAEPVVPRIVHIVFGMDETFGGTPFAFAHYLSLYSAMVETRPERVIFWHRFSPSTPQKPNWWFDRIRTEASRLGILFELKVARSFDTIFRNPIVHFAHQADIIRLEALLEYGGIYLDLDIYTIRSFDALLHFSTVLGIEGGIYEFPRQGLCNGIIIAQKDAPFLQRWYESYRTFNGSLWAANSVAAPLELARKHPKEILALDPMAFFYPLWNNDGLRMVHSRQAELAGESWDFEASGQYAYHAWSSYASKRWLVKLTPDRIFEVDTAFNLLVRRWTSESLREDWRKAIANGL